MKKTISLAVMILSSLVLCGVFLIVREGLLDPTKPSWIIYSIPGFLLLTTLSVLTFKFGLRSWQNRLL